MRKRGSYRIPTVQEHRLILRALGRGISDEKLASALKFNISIIRSRVGMLDGLPSQVVKMLKDKVVNPQTFDQLRKMKPARQLEVAEMMISAVNFSLSYAKALLAATKQTDLEKPEIPKQVGLLSVSQMKKMERELELLQLDFKALEKSYSEDVLSLAVASAYISKLMQNPRVVAYLGKKRPGLLRDVASIIALRSLDDAPMSTGVMQ